MPLSNKRTSPWTLRSLLLNRVMTSNGCPGYKWYVNKTVAVANASVQARASSSPSSPPSARPEPSSASLPANSGPLGWLYDGVTFSGTACTHLNFA